MRFKVGLGRTSIKHLLCALAALAELCWFKPSVEFASRTVHATQLTPNVEFVFAVLVNHPDLAAGNTAV